MNSKSMHLHDQAKRCIQIDKSAGSAPLQKNMMILKKIDNCQNECENP